MRSRRRVRSAFTLVELLVVIGIIAVLIGILLPALNKAKERANTIACASNMRQVFMAARTYAAENNDSLPWGFIYNKENPTNGRPSGADVSYISWFSLLNRYMGQKTPENLQLDGFSLYYDGATKSARFNKAFTCPSVDGSVFKQQVHMYPHTVAMPLSTFERKFDKENAIRPARFGRDLWPDNALFWDSPVWSGAVDDTPWIFWLNSSSGVTTAGRAPGPSTIDGEQLWFPNFPQLRYRKPGDRYYNQAQFEARLLWINQCIGFPTDAYILSLGGDPGESADMDTANGGTWNYGGPRFRHAGTGCNVVFTDGSTKTLFLNKRQLVPNVTTGSYWNNDFLRSYIMLRWPNNRADTGTEP